MIQNQNSVFFPFVLSLLFLCFLLFYFFTLLPSVPPLPSPIFPRPSTPHQNKRIVQRKKKRKEKRGPAGEKSKKASSSLSSFPTLSLLSRALQRSLSLSYSSLHFSSLSSASSSSTSSTSSSIPFSRMILSMSALEGETRASARSHSPVAKTRVKKSPSRAREEEEPECRSTERIASLVSRSKKSPASPESTSVRSDSGRFLGRRPTERMSPLEVRTKGRPSTIRYGLFPGALPLAPLKKASSSSSLLSLKALEKPRKAPTKRREAPMALRREVGYFFLRREKRRKGESASKEKKPMLANAPNLFLAAFFSLFSPDLYRSKTKRTISETKRGSGGGGGGGGAS